MTVHAAHADAFFREVTQHQLVWTIKDAYGYPAPQNNDGKRTMPFWSLDSRARNITEKLPAYTGFEIVSIPLREWQTKWLAGLIADGLLVGVNWSGSSASGYDMEPAEVLKRIAA